jgi:hypothetical protein
MSSRLAQYGTVRYGSVQYGTVQYGSVRYSKIQEKHITLALPRTVCAQKEVFKRTSILLLRCLGIVLSVFCY